METEPTELHVTDLGPETGTFEEEVLRGLSSTPKAIPSKYFYDARGSALFDRICELDEYYPTRTELAIMETYVDEMVACLGRQCLLIEYGSGSSLKTRILLDRMIDPAGYVPIDISREHLEESATRLSEAYPDLEVLPVFADYTNAFDLPTPSKPVHRIAIYFPGSTIGNFGPSSARRFLARMRDVCGEHGALLIGVDLQKDNDVLTAAYNDKEGVTAAFNKNLLQRINRELGGDFNLDAFEHKAVYNADKGRIEMYLFSLDDQHVSVAGHPFHFHAGERLCTELSYKYTLDSFADLANSAGFRVEKIWTDEASYFSVQYLEVRTWSLCNPDNDS